MAQFALNRHAHSELRPDGGVEAGAGRWAVRDTGEMEPTQVIVEVLGGLPRTTESSWCTLSAISRHWLYDVVESAHHVEEALVCDERGRDPATLPFGA